MTNVDTKHQDRTELVMRMERPSSPVRAAQVAEPRTALIRSPEFVVDAAEVEDLQMSALLGGALSAHREMPPPPVRKKRGLRWGLWFSRLLVATVLGSFFLAIAALAMTGVQERARSESKAEARFLQELLLTGSLSEAEIHLAKLEALVAEAKNPKMQAALRARTEATLYRLHDANPSRKVRATKLLALEGARKSSDAWMAEVMLAPASKRAELLRQGEALALPGDAYPLAIRAALEAARGDTEAAKASLDKAETLEPSHVVNLYALYTLARESGEDREAQLVLEQMEDVSPMSPWTRLAIAGAEVDARQRSTALLAFVENTTLPAVTRALAAESALGDPRLALDPETRAHLAEIQTTLVHGDASFLDELPLPPRAKDAGATAPNTPVAPDTIIAPELQIELPVETKVEKKKKRKARRKRRAR